MAFLEAQAAGLPVVAGRTGGVPAVVADGVTGLLTPIGDAAAFAAAVGHLLDRPDERARLAAGAASRIATHHDERAAAHALAAALWRCCDERAVRPAAPRPDRLERRRPPAGLDRHPAQRRRRGRRDDAGACRRRPIGWRRMCSPLQRARRTAELVQPPAPVTVESRLREMSFGVWEGKSVAQLRAEGGETFAAAERLGLDFHPPGGESPRMAMERARRLGARDRRERRAGRRRVAQGRDPRPAGAGDRLGHDGPPAGQARLALPAFLLAHAPTARSTLDRPNVPLRMSARLLPRAAPAGHRPYPPRRGAGAHPGRERLRRAAGLGRRAAARSISAARASTSCRRCARATRACAS